MAAHGFSKDRGLMQERSQGLADRGTFMLGHEKVRYGENGSLNKNKEHRQHAQVLIHEWNDSRYHQAALTGNCTTSLLGKEKAAERKPIAKHTQSYETTYVESHPHVARHRRNLNQEIQSVGLITKEAADAQIAVILAKQKAHDHHEKTMRQSLASLDEDRRKEILQLASDEQISLLGNGTKPPEGGAQFAQQIAQLRAMGFNEPTDRLVHALCDHRVHGDPDRAKRFILGEGTHLSSSQRMNFNDPRTGKGAGSHQVYQIEGKRAVGYGNDKREGIKTYRKPTYPIESETSSKSIGAFEGWSAFDKTGSGYLDADEYEAFMAHNAALIEKGHMHMQDLSHIPVVRPMNLGDYEDQIDFNDIDRNEHERLHRKIHSQNVHDLKTATGRVVESAVAPHILGWEINVKDRLGFVKRHEDKHNISGFHVHEDSRVHGESATLGVQGFHHGSGFEAGAGYGGLSGNNHVADFSHDAGQGGVQLL